MHSWASYLISLSLSDIVSNMDIMLNVSQGCSENYMRLFM